MEKKEKWRDFKYTVCGSGGTDSSQMRKKQAVCVFDGGIISFEMDRKEKRKR